MSFPANVPWIDPIIRVCLGVSMELSELHRLAQGIIEGGALVLAFLVVVAGLTILVMYLVDITQTEQTIRRNYPVVGRFRYFFEHLGEFFRQYFFSQDREELPFNRAQRAWVYRAAKNLNNTSAFGSTRDLRREGSVIFLNCAFPKLDDEAEPLATLTIGPHARHPHTTDTF